MLASDGTGLVLTGQSTDNIEVVGSVGVTVLGETDLDKLLTGGSGNDTIDGGDGSDFTAGGDGADAIMTVVLVVTRLMVALVLITWVAQVAIP